MPKLERFLTPRRFLRENKFILFKKRDILVNSGKVKCNILAGKLEIVEKFMRFVHCVPRSLSSFYTILCTETVLIKSVFSMHGTLHSHFLCLGGFCRVKMSTFQILSCVFRNEIHFPRTE